MDRSREGIKDGKYESGEMKEKGGLVFFSSVNMNLNTGKDFL
jgi:hypothetical protein